MFMIISFVAALIGVGFAGAAALMPHTGVDGTVGAYLALLGTIAVTLALGVLLIRGVSRTVQRLMLFLGIVAALLTALAAYFLMQDGIIAAMGISLLSLFMSMAAKERKTFA